MISRNNYSSKLKQLIDLDLITEEDVRLKFAYKLFSLLGYKDSCSASELAIYGTSGGRKEPPKYADLAYFDDPNYKEHKKDRDWVQNHSLVIVEIKKPNEKLDQHYDQAIYYAIFSRAPLVILTNGEKIVVMVYDGYDKFKEIKVFLRRNLIDEWGEVKKFLAYSRIKELKKEKPINGLDTIDYSQYIKTISDEITEEIRSTMGFYIQRFLTPASLNFPFSLNPKKDEERNESISSEQAFSKNSRLMILGEPGSGKSCLLNHLALEIINNSSTIPIIIKAKYWGYTFDTILKAIENSLKPCIANIDEDIISSELRSNKYIILIDGYDEIKNSREVFESELNSLSKISKIKLILTSRKANYHGELPALNAYNIIELSNSQIDEYAKNVRSIDFFSYHLSELNLLDLARLPLYLFMLSSIAYSDTIKVKNKAILHERFASYLMEDYVSKRIPGYEAKYPIQLKMQFLSWIAERKTLDPLFSDYISCFKGLNILDDPLNFMKEVLESGILKGTISSFEFIHSTFREFFYARSIALTTSENIIRFLEECHDNDEFFNIILFLVGVPKERAIQKNILNYLEINDLFLYIKSLDARYIDSENVNDYSKFEYNYFYQLQCTYNSLLNNFFSSIKINFVPYSWIIPDQRASSKDLKVQVIGYIDVPNRRIRYGYKFIGESDQFEPLIKTKESFSINSRLFYKDTSIPGLDLDSSRELAIEDVKSQLKNIIKLRLLVHPPEIKCEIIVAVIKDIASTARMFSDKSLEPLWKYSYSVYEALEYYDTFKRMRDHEFISVGNEPKWLINIEAILTRLDELITKEISITKNILLPYFSCESSPHLGDEMEIRLKKRLNVMYSILPHLYSDIVDSNFLSLRKYMVNANIYPFKCIVKYQFGPDFSKKGIIRCPLGEASVYFKPTPKGEPLNAIIERGDPDISKEDQIKLTKEYIDNLKSLGRYSRNNYLHIFKPAVTEIIDNLALTNALYDLLKEDLKWFIDDR